MTSQVSKFSNVSFIQRLAQKILDLIGWHADTIYMPEKKYLLVGAHHTSNWDLPLAVLFMMSTGIFFNFLAKDEAFRWPFGSFMRWLGGIPVNRRASTHFVDQIAEEYKKRDSLIVAITPEGTRKKTTYWKTGFYYMALAANVPIILGYLDYPNRRLGFGKIITPSGDLEADLDIIRAFYADKKGKYPNEHGEIRVRPSA